MGSFGERMQREREMRGITLEEIAESTKIGTRSLRALEVEDFDKLPGGIFNKGFVRAYARYLGIDEEQAVTDFMAAYGDHQKQQPENVQQPNVDESDDRPASLNLLALGGVIAVLGVFFVLWGFRDNISEAALRLAHRFRPVPAAPAPTRVAAASSVVPQNPPPSPQPAGASGAATTSPESATPGGAAPKTAKLPAAEPVKAAPEITGAGFDLLVHARQDAWVKIKADDELLMEGILKGEKTVHARQKVVFTTGNAGAIELSFNGEPQPVLGSDNQVKTVVFTPDGRVR